MFVPAMGKYYVRPSRHTVGNFIAGIPVYRHAFRAGDVLLLWGEDQELEQIFSQECCIEREYGQDNGFKL